jgi:hypothetical protein
MCIGKLKGRSQERRTKRHRQQLQCQPEEEDDYVLFKQDRYLYKGIGYLMDAFVKVSGRFKGLKLVLAGYEFNRVSELVRGSRSVRERVITRASSLERK